MDWFNYYGLAFMAVILIPNIIYAIKHKDTALTYNNKAATVLEQIGRYGCMVLMIFNIPYTYIGFWFSYGLVVYLAVNITLVLTYILAWIFLRNKSGIVRALLLSVLPSIVFIFSAAMLANIPLFVFAVIFAVTHIFISVKNAKTEEKTENIIKKNIITVTSIILLFVFVVVGSFGSIALYGQNSLSKLDNMSAMDMIKYDCSSKNSKISIALIENGNVTYKTFGSGGEEDKIYDFEIGSISKTFLGLLCTKAASEGKLNIKDSISAYLDLDDTKYYPTIERLLTHTSGYSAYYFESRMIANRFARISNDFYGISKAQILSKVKDTDLEDKDYLFVYSNFGISVLGLVLEKIYDDDFTDIMNGFIRNELNLSNTEAAKQSGNLNNYWRWKSNDGYIPAGSIISDIKDMSSYLNMYLTNNLPYTEEAYQPLKVINANNETYEKLNIRIDSIGMTWIIDNENGIIWHDGATTDFNSYMGFTKDRQRGVIILSNLNHNDKISMTVIGAKILTDINSFSDFYAQ